MDSIIKLFQSFEMHSIIKHLQSFGHVWLFGCILLFVVVNAFIKFIMPSRRLQKKLQLVIDGLRAKTNHSKHPFVDLKEIESEIMKDEKFLHLWSEYCETLHPQKITNDSGQEVIGRWRATALAEIFFTEEALVDIPLEAEFYKHLPGILTGIGIIGTFSGLIMGLVRFNVKGNATVVQESLGILIQSVGFAFMVSALAICFAMIFTWIEKSFITNLHRQVEEICQLIDSFFDAGAEDEYLERLVKASESSATQAAQIKDSLVADLKQILAEITSQQIEAFKMNNQQLSNNIAKGISDTMHEPIQRISLAVDRVSGNQGEAIHKLLMDVMSNFSAQMSDIFGGQMKGLSNLLQATAETMQSSATRFDQLADNLGKAGEGAANTMTEELTKAIASMEARQQVANNQMHDFVESMRSLLKESQSETSKKMNMILEELSSKVTSMVSSLEEQSLKSTEKQIDHQNKFIEHTSSTVGSFSDNVGVLIGVMKATTESMQKNITMLSQSSRESIDRLNAGAETLYSAASDFAKAGQSVGNTLKAATPLTDNIQKASSILSNASMGVQNVMEEYKRTRDAFSAIVSDLKSTVENAKREASLSSGIVKGFQDAAVQLSGAQKEAEEYLRGVTGVLTEAHSEFAKSIERTLRKGSAQFHEQLSTAVNLLSGAIQELGDVVESIADKK